MATVQQYLNGLYITMYNRAADNTGYNFWLSSLGLTPAAAASTQVTDAQAVALSNAFVGNSTLSAYFDSQYGLTSNSGAKLSDTAFVEKLYNNLGGNNGDTAGVLFWTGKLAAGESRSQMTGEFVKTFVELNLGTKPNTMTQSDYDAAVIRQATFNNKILVSQDFASKTASNLQPVTTTDAAFTASQRAIVGVTSDNATRDQAIAQVDAAAAANNPALITSGGGGSSGQVFTLTTGSDSIPGMNGSQGNSSTAGDDVINGFSAAGGNAATDTLTAGDSINGGLGSNTLNETNTATAADVTAGANISNIQTYNIRNTGATTASISTLNAALVSSLTAVNSNIGTGDVVVTGLASGASAGMIGNGVTLNGILTFGYVATATAGTLNLTNGTIKTNSVVNLDQSVGTLVATLTINSTGASNGIKNLNMASAGTAAVNAVVIHAATSLDLGTGITNFKAASTTGSITVDGAAASVKLGTIEATKVKTIDASGMTAGGITAVLNNNVTISVKGGDGADLITTGAVLTTGTVDARGGTDTLEIAAGGTHVASAALGAKYTNFETLRLNDTQDVSFVGGITALELNAMTSKTISNITATQAAAIKVLATQTTAVTLTLADATGSSDVVNLALTSATATTNVNVAALGIKGVETLNINATTGTAGTQDTITFAAGALVDKLTTIGIAGSAEVAIDGTNIVKAVTLTNTGTGKFFATGDFAIGSVINGSATAVNAFTASTTIEGQTYNGGAGNDTFSTLAAIINADGTTDTVMNGNGGTDTLTISDAGAVTLTDSHFTNITNMEGLTLSAAGNTSLTSGGSFKTAFANGVTITQASHADSATATYALGLYDKVVTLALTTTDDGATTADNISITSGSAADTITVTASSWVGGAANGTLKVLGGAGADSITVSIGTFANATANANALQITGGTGADIISVTHVNGTAAGGVGFATFTVAAGDSTTTAFDMITGFKIATATLNSDLVDFATVVLGNVYGATAATGFTASELTVAVAATGAVTFAGSLAASATLATKIAAVQSVVTTVNGDSAFFVVGTDTYVFNNNTSGDSVVELVGVSTATSLIAANTATNLGISVG